MDQCLDCVRKHLCQAMIIQEEEVPLGYPAHIDRVVGHLCEASREALPKYVELARIVRDYRLRVMDDPGYLPPYKAILGFVKVLIVCENQNLPIPAPPDELKLPVVTGD